MSLFPAYSDISGPTSAEQTESVDKKEWLQNYSFKPEYSGLLENINRQKNGGESEDSSPDSGTDDVVSQKDAEVHDDGAVAAAKIDEDHEDVHHLSRKRSHKASSIGHETDDSEVDTSCENKKKKKKEKKKEKKKSKKKHKLSSEKSKHKHRRSESPRGRKQQSEEIDRHSPTYLSKYHLKVVFIEDIAGLPVEKAFREDRKPDHSNWQYGELYKMHIAKYHLYTRAILGSQMVLGQNKKHKPSISYSRYHSKHNRISKEKKSDVIMDLSQFIQTKEKPVTISGREDFISIDIQVPTESVKSYNPLGVYDKATEMYIQGKMQQQQQSINVSSHLDRLKQQVANYNKYLYENPNDVDKWLEFVDFQDEAVMLREEQADQERQQKRDALVQEIKESVLEKALDKNPGSLQLQLAQLEMCRLSWESSKLRKAWKQLTFHHPNNPCVWWLYLEHIRTSFSSFTVSAMMKLYAKCVKTLWNVVSGTLQSHKPMPFTHQHILEIILEAVMILWQSGHMERATAICQAILEFNLNCPEVLQQVTSEERLEFLEAFWDGSLPRLGEDNAQGWNHWVDTKGDNSHFGQMYTRASEENFEEELLQQHTSCKHQAWVAMETSRMSRHWLPWHPDVEEGEGDEDCEDPERLVLFDDIKDFICPFSEPHQQLRILMTYLSILGVDCVSDPPSHTQPYIKHMRTHLDSPHCLLHDDSLHHGCHPLQLNQALQSKVINNIFEQTVSRFTGSERSELTALWLSWKLQEYKITTRDASKKEKKLKAKEMKHFAKKILSEEINRNDLRVWEAFGMLEWGIGNVDEGDKVLTGALTMANLDLRAGHIMPKGCIAARLYRTYAEHLFKSVANQTRTATQDELLHTLVTLALVEKYKIREASKNITAVQVLKARRGFQSGLDVLMSGETLNSTPSWVIGRVGSLLEHWTICYAMFEYVTNNLSAALSVLHQVLDKLQPHQSQKSTCLLDSSSGFDLKHIFYEGLREVLTSSVVLFAQHHIKVSISPLRTVRDPLMTALHDMPDHKTLLKVFVDVEGPANIAGQLRRRLLPVAKLSHTPLPWITAILADMMRQQSIHLHQQQLLAIVPSSASLVDEPRVNLHGLRAWIEKAISNTNASHCILLWRLYMYLEKKHDNIENVKAIFYRSLQHCPWAKSLYMDFVNYCPGHMQEVCDLLTEKELRLRTPLEELQLLYKGATTLQGMKEGTALTDASEESGEHIDGSQDKIGDSVTGTEEKHVEMTHEDIDNPPPTGPTHASY